MLQANTSRPRVWRGLAGEAVIVFLVVGLLCVFYASLAWLGFDLLEEGYFLTHARRVMEGGLPYRDFSTPYTPGVFYLYAWMMEWLRADLVTLRLVSVAARAVAFVALYSCARQLMSAPFAVIAPSVLLVMDTAPELWGIHPGWLTTAAALLGVLAIARYLADGRPAWLVVAGAFAGVAVSFKQNLAAYLLMAALWFLVVAARRLPPLATGWRWPTGGRLGRLILAARLAFQVAAIVLLPLTAAVIVRPYFSPLVAVLYVLPLAALSALGCAVFLSRQAPSGFPEGTTSEGDPSGPAFFLRPLLFLAGFGVVTLPWLVALVRALDWRIDLLGSFVGQIDPTGYYFPMEPFTADHVRLAGVALLPALVVFAAGRAGLWGRLGAAAVLGALLIAAVAVLVGAPPPADGGQPWSVVGGVQRLALALGDAWHDYGGAEHPTDNLILYLPSIAFWGAYAAWLLSGDGKPGNMRLWYLAAGAALLLNQYPRMDEIHLLWSAGPLLVAGADVLHGLYRRAIATAPDLGASTSGRAALALSLAVLPAVACLPHLWWRVAAWSYLAEPPVREVHAAAVGPDERLAPLALPGGGRVWLREEEAEPVAEVVDLLLARTAPGEPVFTYPAIPGFTYLADRPAASRYLHLFAGMAAPADQAEIVRQLEAVDYVVWDDGGAHFWVRPGDNAPVTEYVRTHFRVERYIGPYTVLSRDAAGPYLSYTVPPG